MSNHNSNEHEKCRPRYPLSRPPSASPTYITREQVTSLAHATNRAAGGGIPPSAPTYAAIMTYREYGEHLHRRKPGNATVNPQRMVWVVTVHADIYTRGTAFSPPAPKHVYTVIYDAETGTFIGACVGCDHITADFLQRAAGHSEQAPP